jgi:hypothetical protein
MYKKDSIITLAPGHVEDDGENPALQVQPTGQTGKSDRDASVMSRV